MLLKCTLRNGSDNRGKKTTTGLQNLHTKAQAALESSLLVLVLEEACQALPALGGENLSLKRMFLPSFRPETFVGPILCDWFNTRNGTE